MNLCIMLNVELLFVFYINTNGGIYMYIKTVGYRLLAFYIDIIVVLIIGIFLNLLFGFGTLNTEGQNFSYSFNLFEATVIFTAYFTLIEYFMYGKSVGKIIFGIDVRKEDMQPFEDRKSYLLRGLIKGLLILSAPVAFIVVVFNKKKQSFHDSIMKTIVVRKVKPSEIIEE